ncbi:MAG: 23S rRNA (guanosine(2251)-2'-O)-methyltransferase RlmB [Elusimicrobia bacterium GWA2_56_46]|nr:MAG: 23S rRNA (guanosine(2251)-2'-O)-methyltransferase RlmB [Elusimicrobia bacterium GWA2_56_46]OGR56057.1 MAG: 23S rRNA (guanosine(2251)-2'-O)-methyltransferase RlmB [Elusimicrobia bacterium GWC2_56_31]HBB67922.1 23S rRNA (guanosine(2251)-2'-O)-methyltransferase RlmB [Elusimicrobiota bacterium]HBW22889.1 23S rRNA (guanosine(2251)-2'-O)-methyltransferase RlmB [Elusimicrobiota bacterium]
MKPEMLYGANTAEEILKSGRRKVFRLYVSDGSLEGKAKLIVSMARKAGCPVEFRNPRSLDHIANGGNHQGVILEVEPVRTLSLAEALARIKDPKKTVWAGVDGITDPMNLGAIIRSAACFGVSAVILPERRTVGLTPAAQKTASGAIEKVDMVEVGNLNQTILELKKKNFWVYGADMKGKPVDKTDFAFPVFMLIGSEGEGLHQKTMEHCDELVSIPQKGGVESLNASVAAGVLFYEISKKL